MEKARMRRRTDRGTDIGLVLERGTHLHHGDVLDVKGKLIVVEQLPEKVVTITLDSSGSRAVGKAVLVGHAIGNRHRPISVANGRISFPIQHESELQIFERLLPAGVSLNVTTEVFIPSGDAHPHE
jgi:urease accessory protein